MFFFSFRLIRIQYDFILIKVFQMHAEGVLYTFFHVHNFETFVYGANTISQNKHVHRKSIGTSR